MIKLVINCDPENCRNWFLNDLDYQWMFIPDPLKAKDLSETNIECLIYDVADLVSRYSVANHAIMLHCSGYDGVTAYAGCRSAAILIGVMMVTLNISYDDAFKIVNKKWAISMPQRY